MEFIQKKGSVTHTFTLHDDHYNFAYVDRAGSGDMDLRYADFPQKPIIQIEQNEWLRNVGYLWVALGTLQFGYAVYASAPLSGRWFWIAVGIACVAWAHFSKITYSVFKTNDGNIFIIHDKSHDMVVDELRKRKKMQLLTWYGDINPDNALENEIEKFRWLAAQDVISQEECDKKIAQVEFLHQHKPDAPAITLN